MKEKIIKNAEKHGLQHEIVWGICQVESNFNPYAVRYEPGYKWLFNPRELRPINCAFETECAQQRTSYGLMQVMGAVFRELGYRGWLTQIICDIDTQLEYGCRYLWNLISRYGFEGGIEAYNAGIPQQGQSGYYKKIVAASKEF